MCLLLFSNVNFFDYFCALNAVVSMPNPAVSCSCTQNHLISPMFNNIVSLLKLSSSVHDVRRIHGFMVSTGFYKNIFLLCKLIDATSSFGFHSYVFSLFTATTLRDVYLYNTVIKALSKSSLYAKPAVMMYAEIRAVGLQPDTYTVPFVLRAVSLLLDIRAGRQIHCCSSVSGLSMDVNVSTGLVRMYSDCGFCDDARQVFDEMKIKAADVFLWNAMLAGYVKVGDMESARGLFEIMPVRDVISWTSVISGCVQMNRPTEAIEMFRRMQLANVKPDEVAVLAALSACADLNDIHLSDWIISYIGIHGLRKTVQISNACINMYAKSGNIQKALEVFENMKVRSVVSWTTMIAGLAMHGLGNKANEMFTTMEQAGVKPNAITFLSILSACAHGGLIDLSWRYLDLMYSRYGIKPTIEHFGCMVDLLGRAGYLEQAEKLVMEMPFEGNKAIWGSILASARVHGHVSLARRALKHLVVLEPSNSGNFMLLSNTLASGGKWDEASMVRKIMNQTSVKKVPGGSFIQVDSEVHWFFSGEKSHSQYVDICEVSNIINIELNNLKTNVYNLNYEM